MDRLYFDNAAKSYSKPEVMIKPMVDFNANVGANPGRSGHRLSIEAGRIIFHARQTVASFLGADDPQGVVFTPNAAESMNTILHGLLRFGDHDITSSMEHNSVFRGNGAGRPAGCKPVGPVSEAGRRFDSPCPFQKNQTED